MENKPQARIARLTVVFIGILTLAGAASAARFEGNFFDSSTAVSFGETFNTFNGTVGFYTSQAADRYFRNVTRLSFNETARIRLKNLARCNCYEAPSVDRNVNKVIAFSSYLPANLGFNYSTQFNLDKSLGPSFQQTADFNFGGTAQLFFNNPNKFTSTDLDSTTSQTGLPGFMTKFENPGI